MTKDQVDNLKVGDFICTTLDLDGFTGDARPGAKYGKPRRIVDIIARGYNYKDKRFVCFRTAFGPDSTVSGTAEEDRSDVILHATLEDVIKNIQSILDDEKCIGYAREILQEELSALQKVLRNR